MYCFRLTLSSCKKGRIWRRFKLRLYASTVKKVRNTNVIFGNFWLKIKPVILTPWARSLLQNLIFFQDKDFSGQLKMQKDRLQKEKLKVKNLNFQWYQKFHF